MNREKLKMRKNQSQEGRDKQKVTAIEKIGRAKEKIDRKKDRGKRN